MGMTITFVFRKDWTGSNYVPPGSGMAQHAMSFKKGESVTGEVIDSATKDPSNYIVITKTDGQVRVPFGGMSYQGENAILESPVAPWLAQSPVDTTPRGDVTVTTSGETNTYFGLKNIGDKTVMIVIVSLIILIAVFFIYLVIKKNKKK